MFTIYRYRFIYRNKTLSVIKLSSNSLLEFRVVCHFVDILKLLKCAQDDSFFKGGYYVTIQNHIIPVGCFV